jgi:D-3-phosphoglycerate dehydrogenase
MILSLFNKLNEADREIRSDIGTRKQSGHELDGKVVGIMVMATWAKFAKGFDVRFVL